MVFERICSNGNSYTNDGKKGVIALLLNCLAVSYKSKINITIRPAILLIGIYLHKRNKTYPYENLYRIIHGSFLLLHIHNLQREKEKERDINAGKNMNWLPPSSMHPNLRQNPQLRNVPWPAIEPGTSWCTGWCCNQLNYTGWAMAALFLITKYLNNLDVHQLVNI